MSARVEDFSNTVAIIGAGPAGLAAARALEALSVPYLILEKHDGVGGIWNPDNAGSPMYQSAHFISSKYQSGHYGFPMPECYADYPRHDQILAYIRSFADNYNLLPNIRFNSNVIEARQQSNQWLVSYEQHGELKKTKFGWLICASGTNWYPNRPTLQGEAGFSGEIIHSSDYQDPRSLEGQRVLVVGAGNSGVDIVCDAAFSAKEAYFSLRRGYHFVPKHIFGMPADVFGSQSSWLPLKLQQLIFGGLLRLLNGDLSRLGLAKPDHKVLSSHPIVNSQVLHYLQHGDISARPDVDFLKGNKVFFKDGSSVEVDKIILATGYQWKIPFLAKHCFEWLGQRPQARLKIFNEKYPTLFLAGFVETNGGAYKLFDDMAYLIARTISAQRKQSEVAKEIQAYIAKESSNLGGKIQYVQSVRHSGYTNSDAFKKAMKKMRRHFGWPDLNERFYAKAEKA